MKKNKLKKKILKKMEERENIIKHNQKEIREEKNKTEEIIKEIEK
jgi:hypothetical protein